VNRQCNLTKRIQTSKGPRYCPVVLSANGRIKPDLVLVGDREERHPEGAYYISWYEGKRLIRPACMPDVIFRRALVECTGYGSRRR